MRPNQGWVKTRNRLGLGCCQYWITSSSAGPQPPGAYHVPLGREQGQPGQHVQPCQQPEHQAERAVQGLRVPHRPADEQPAATVKRKTERLGDGFTVRKDWGHRLGF